MNAKHFYLLSIIIAVAGFAAFAGYVYRGYMSLNDLLVPIYAPGQTIINTEKGDIYQIYYEGNDKVHYNGYHLTLTVKDNNGTSMPISKVNEKKQYSYRGRTGKAVYQVNLPKAGNYGFSASVSNGRHSKKLTLIFDKGFSERRSHTVVTAQAILLFPVLLSAVLFLYAYSKKVK